MPLLLICILLPMARAMALTYFISPGMSIQELVWEAVDGDTIVMEDGDYQESVLLENRSLTIGSRYLLDNDTLHIAATVLRPTGEDSLSGSCFYCTDIDAPGSRIVGLTLESGPGSWCAEYPHNRAGGAIYQYLADLEIAHCRFVPSRENARASMGGSIFVHGGWGFDSRLRLTDCCFQGCRAQDYGGAVYARLCSLYVQDCRWDSCRATFVGTLYMTDLYTEFERSTIRRGSATEFEGGIFAGGCRGWISGCTFENNSSGVVAHLSVSNGYLLVTRCLFRDAAGGMPIVFSGTTEPMSFIGNCVIGDNGDSTAGTVILGGYRGELAYNLFANNINPRGGTLYVLQRCQVRVHHNWFEANVNERNDWGAAIITQSDRLRVDSNAFCEHNGPVISDFEGFPSVPIHVEHNWWGHESGPYHPTQNPIGRGDTLMEDDIYFIPWLTSPPDTTLPQSAAPRERETLPRTWRLLTCYPNPFNSTIRIALAGFTAKDFRLTLHNLLGQEVAVLARGAVTGGEISFTAPATLASGIYFLRASDRQHIESRKLMLLR